MRNTLIATASVLALIAVSTDASAQSRHRRAAPAAPTVIHAQPAPEPVDENVEATTTAEAEMAAPAEAPADVVADVPAPEAMTDASGYTDAQLQSFNSAMTTVRAVSEQVQGGAPTPEQQAEMAAAVEASGLGIAQFNAIGQAVSGDPVLQARLAVLNAPAPAAGSVAASVTESEIDEFAGAMTQVRTIAPTDGTAPTAEQQASMAAAIEASGLDLERFNAISTAVSQDAGLRARVELAATERTQTN